MRKHIITLLITFLLPVTASGQDFSFDSMSINLDEMKQGARAVAAPAPEKTQGETPQVPKAQTGKEWLILVFISGNNDLGALNFAENDINEMEKGLNSNSVSVVVESSILRSDDGGVLTMQENSQTLMIRPDKTDDILSPVIYDGKYGNYDMGDANHLVRFAISNIEDYPAKKVMLVVWNHGSGGGGIAYDDISGNHISGASLGRALKEINSSTGKKINLFATDACLMQTAKVAYELFRYTDIIVGSQETIPGGGFPYDTILGALSGNPGMGAAALGKVIVEKYRASYSGFRGTTLSALDSSYLPSFVYELNNWIKIIRNDDDALTKIADSYDSIAQNTFKFSTEDNKDFCNFIDQLGTIFPSYSEIMRKGRELRNLVSHGVVISHKATNGSYGGDYVSNTCGLAIYLPEKKYKGRKYNSFIFARDTYWDDLIKDIFIKLDR